MRFVLPFLLAIALALPARAQAQPSAADLLGGVNAFVNGNFSSTDDTEGAAIIGGNLSGTGTFQNLGVPLGVTLSGFGALNVYGGAGTSSYNITNQGQVRIGGANAGSTFSGASSITYGNAFPVARATMWNQITALSAGLANLAPTTPAASLPSAGSNNAVITAIPATVNGIANVAVIDITAALLGSYTGLQVNLNGASTVIINVSGNYNAQPNWMNGSAYNQRVIWNFENATTVALGATGIQGTVLAPTAHVTLNNPIDGGLFAASFSGNGELHYRPFIGSTALLNSVSTTVPEPASLALFATGAAGLALLRRRRGPKRD